jgi:NAD(P)H-flavin reductase
MIATVTGIAPFISMLRSYIHTGAGSHRFYILHGASYHNEFGYKDEIERLSKKYTNIVYIPTVSRPQDEKNKGWQGEFGRVNLIVEKYIERFLLEPANTIVYACGHPEMIRDVRERLGNRGYKLREEKYWE